MKVTLWACTNLVGSKVKHTIEIDDDEWAEMDVTQKEEYMLDEFWGSNIIEWGWDEE